MDADDPKDLLFQTYYMMDWKSTRQTDSDQKCITCGGGMKMVGPMKDAKGSPFDGLVCHHCKSIFWVRQS